jgi:hypothetical protein
MRTQVETFASLAAKWVGCRQYWMVTTQHDRIGLKDICRIYVVLVCVCLTIGHILWLFFIISTRPTKHSTRAGDRSRPVEFNKSQVKHIQSLDVTDLSGKYPETLRSPCSFINYVHCTDIIQIKTMYTARRISLNWYPQSINIICWSPYNRLGLLGDNASSASRNCCKSSIHAAYIDSIF